MIKRALNIHDYPAKWLRVYLKAFGEAVMMWTPEVMRPGEYEKLLEEKKR